MFGTLTLVPREGVHAKPGHDAYADPRLAGARRVDYGRPGFAVVYVPDVPSPTLEAAAMLSIRETAASTRFEPAGLAVALGGRLEVRNRGQRAYTLSCPELDLLSRLAPGATLRVDVARAGESRCFLLDVPAAEAVVFAATGPFAVVSEAGHYALVDLPPGLHQLRAWHPRFPPLAHEVEVAADRTLRFDLRMGVGRAGDTP